MTKEALTDAIAGYRSGLQAELTLLDRLRALSQRQHEARDGGDVTLLAEIGDEREAVLASLVEVEHHVKPIRELLAAGLEQATRMPGFDELVALHQTARGFVAAILAADSETIQSLRAAENARRVAAQTVERGATTLAAYRRVVAPQKRSAIVDTKG